MGKMREAFLTQMRNAYTNRKNKEFISMLCAEHCLKKAEQSFLDDRLNQTEKRCLAQCFHKTYSYLVHANTVYTYMTTDEDTFNKAVED